MANTDLIIPIVVAAIGLVGSLISLLLSYFAQKKAHENERDLESYKNEVTHGQTVANLREKYGQPLLVAAYDLQQRLFELVEYPISRQHMLSPDGLEDIKQFTCFQLAQYLAYTYILRTKTGYLSFVKDTKLAKLRNMMYMIDEELDRRRGSDGLNVGVWPAARVLICERMIVKKGVAELNDALDGGFGLEVKAYDDFSREWKEGFSQPMGYFCEWIDLMLEGRVYRREHNDAAMRCLQHLLVDLVSELDQHHAYIPAHKSTSDLKCGKSTVGCDCSEPDCRQGKSLEDALKGRQMTRLDDCGVWSYNGLFPEKKKNALDREAISQADVQRVKSLTCVVDLQ